MELARHALIRLIFPVFSLSFVIPECLAETRQWTASDGRTLEAEYVSATDDSVTLKRVVDGKTFTLPLTNLSKGDQEWVVAKMNEPEPIEGPFASLITGEWEQSEDDGLPFCLYGAADLDGGEKYPLVVSLHGRSQNNENGKQLTIFTRSFIDPDRYAKNPCIVFAPLAYQPFGGEGIGWHSEPGEKALVLIEKLVENLPIDETRVYVVGHSMGGFGTCHFMTQNPKRFTAGVATAGCSGPSSADTLEKEPLWLHHAADDPVVEVDSSRNLAEALKRSKVFKYTEYETGGHGIARQVFESDEVHEWLFSQQD